MVRIYVQDKPLILAESANEIEGMEKKGVLIEYNPNALNRLMQDMENPEVTAAVLIHQPVSESLDGVKATLKLIQAGGGMVCTPDNEVLLIFRKGKWDLPKGKLDEGEDLATCALREIEEETGATNLKIVQPLAISYHTYHHKGKHILKESHWYLVRTQLKSALRPQLEEDIQESKWVPLHEVAGYKTNMHSSVKDVIDIGLALLKPAP